MKNYMTKEEKSDLGSAILFSVIVLGSAAGIGLITLYALVYVVARAIRSAWPCG